MLSLTRKKDTPAEPPAVPVASDVDPYDALCAEIEALAARDAIARQARDAAAGEVARLRAERAQLAAHGGDVSAMQALTRAIHDAEDAHEVAASAADILSAQLAPLAARRLVMEAERRVGEHARALAEAQTARDALRELLRTIALETVPPVVEAVEMANARLGAAALAANAAETLAGRAPLGRPERVSPVSGPAEWRFLIACQDYARALDAQGVTRETPLPPAA